MDAAGKDGAVRAVLSCLSPQGVSEHSFKVPSSEESRHDYLWRFWDAIPEKGSISIFNRSYYEDVLVQKVHKLYEKNKYADRIELDSIIEQRYEQISNFEKYLWENSIRVVKIFLNVSKDEQGRRFISRIDTPKRTGSSPRVTLTNAATGMNIWMPMRPASTGPPVKTPPGTLCRQITNGMQGLSFPASCLMS